MWYFLRHTKHLPDLHKICFHNPTSVTTLQELEEWLWRQYEHPWGVSSVISTAAVRVCLRCLWDGVSTVTALSLASIYLSMTFIKESRSHLLSMTLQLTTSQKSCGNLLINMEDKRLPYNDGVIPRDFKPLTWVSTLSKRCQSSLRLWDDTTSKFSRVSICLFTICCLFPNLFFLNRDCFFIISCCVLTQIQLQLLSVLVTNVSN